MALYDVRGKIIYLDMSEVNRIVSIYENFGARVEALNAGDSRVHANCLLNGEIGEVRRLPQEIRYGNGFNGLTDRALTDLEKRCKKILGKK